jgi:hypothetical protein
MSDDPVLAALARLEANITRVETEQTRMREQFDNKLDDILGRLPAVREDTDNTPAQVLYGLENNLTLSQRITKLEDQMRRSGN